jgi:SAM-dependent methyltransferase
MPRLSGTRCDLRRSAPPSRVGVFKRSGRFYDAVYAFKDYAAEAERLHELVSVRAPEARTLLDVACGTGKHLAELRRWYEVEGLDLEPELLAIARERLGDVPLHGADMVDFDLGRRFDVVTCLFSSIGYVRTEENLRRATTSMARHIEPGGLLVVEPWILPGDWTPGGVYAQFVDEPDLKVARVNVSPPAGETVVLEMHHLVGTPAEVTHFVERHELGMFTDEQYADAFRAAGLEVERDPEGLMGRGLYLGTRGA